MRVGKLSGVVGTYAATDPELERLACERLGLEPAPVSTQILQRDRHAELLSALAVLASSLDKFALEIVPLWHERDISHSSAERVAIPDAFLATDYMLDRFAWLVEGLVVDEERMRRNVDASHWLFASQRLLLALIDSGLSRDDAYRRVQAHALQAWEGDLDLRDLVRADPDLAGRVELDHVFSLEPYVRHVDTVFERLRALERREEPVHA